MKRISIRLSIAASKFTRQLRLTAKSLVTVSVLLCTAQVASSQIQTKYFVDPVNGNDANTGKTVSSAFKSIIAARNAVRLVNGNMTGDIVIYLRGGIYQLSETIQFDEHDSGTNNHYVIFQAFPGEQPILSGGRTITNWSLYNSTNNIWKATYNEKILTRQLFVNGQRVTRAKLDDTTGVGRYKYDNIGLRTNNPALKNYKNLSDIEFVFKGSWRNPHCLVSSVSNIGTDSLRITMNPSGWYYVTNQYNFADITTAKAPWYYENAYELLDNEGEWYLDGTGAVSGDANTFYYKPYSSENVNSSSIVAPTLEKLVTVTGASKTRKVTNFKLIGIGFQYTTWTGVSKNGWLHDYQNNILAYVDPSDLYLLNGSALAFKFAKNVYIQACDFSHLGGAGINFYSGCQKIRVIGNKFEDISATAVQFGDLQYWKENGSENNENLRDTLLMLSNDTIKNNYVIKCGLDYRGATGLAMTFTQNALVSHNEVGYMPYIGIHCGWGWSYNPSNVKVLKINNNYVHDVIQDLDDGGPIYVLGRTDTTATDSCHIDSNYVRSSRDEGIYFDNYSRRYIAQYNVCTDIVNRNIHISTPDKRDIKVYQTYADDAVYSNSGTNTYVQPLIVVSGDMSGNTKAAAIIKKAGLEPGYLELRGQPLVNENFNQSKLDSIPSAYTITATGAGSVVAVKDPNSTGDRSVYLSKTVLGTGNVTALKVIKPVYGKVILLCKIRTDSTGYWKSVPIIMSDSGKIITHIAFRGSAIQIPEATGGTFTTLVSGFTPGSWYNLKIVMNTELKKYDVYINNLMVIQQKDFYDVTAANVSQCSFSINSSNKGNSYFDDLKIYTDELYLNEDFNSTDTLKVPYKWKAVVSNTASSVKVKAFPSATDRSLELYISGTGESATATKNIDAAFGKVVVNCRVRAGQTTGWNNAPYILDQNNNAAVSCIFNAGNIQLYKGGSTYVTIQSFTANTWYDLKFVIDTETKKVDVWVNGVKKVSADSLRTVANRITGINYSTSGLLNVDNVRIYHQE